MKFSHFLLAASLCSFTAASAQTTPSTQDATGTAPGPRGSSTASPSTVPSGTAPAASNPRGAVSSGEVFTTGAPAGTTGDRRTMKRKKDKSTMPDGRGKMKTKM